MKSDTVIIRLRIPRKNKLKIIENKNLIGQSINSFINVAIDKELVRRSGKYNINPF